MSRRDSGKTSGHPLGMGFIQELDQEPRWDQENAWEGKAQMGQPELGTWPGTVAPHRAGSGRGQTMSGGSGAWKGTVGLCLPTCHWRVATSQVTVTPLD